MNRWSANAIGLALAVAVAVSASNSAADDADAVARATPLAVVELASGGSWREGDQEGSFRALVIDGGTAERPVAEVVLQWLRLDPGGGLAQLAATVPIKEFNELHLPHATLRLDDSVEGEVQLYIESENRDGTPLELRFFATAPGQYAILTELTPPSGTSPPGTAR